MNKKSTKRRPKQTKKSNFRRLYIGVFAIFSLLLISLLFYISNKHFNKDNQKPQIIVTNTKKDEKNEKKPEKTAKKTEQKPVINFRKDENLSKIFLDPKSNDETYALKQTPKESVKKEISIFDALKDINKSKKLEQNATKTEKILKTDEVKIEPKHLEKQIQKTEEKLEILEKNEQKTEIKKNEQISKQQPEINKKNQTTNIKKPKLAIIIDDVASRAHVQMIRQTGLKKLTPSFFPNNKFHPDTPNLANEFEFFMIHLPMQANHFLKPELDTLTISDSYALIDKKIASIRANFPKAKFINNHTGSRFTSDFNAMDLAYTAFNKYNFIFLDSKTTANSKVKDVAKKHKKPYIYRDVFLDDNNDKNAIKSELVSAIERAKKQGFAITIGHPRKNTIDVLKQNKEYILNNVELVYVKDIYEFYR